MTYNPDPAARLALIRAEMARQQAKMPRVDHNGYPVNTAPAEVIETEAILAEPVRRAPRPNPALGGSANGDPFAVNGDPTQGMLPPPEEDGAAHVGVRTELTRMRNLMRQDEHRREDQQRAAHLQAINDNAARLNYQQRR